MEYAEKHVGTERQTLNEQTKSYSSVTEKCMLQSGLSTLHKNTQKKSIAFYTTDNSPYTMTCCAPFHMSLTPILSNNMNHTNHFLLLAKIEDDSFSNKLMTKMH